MQRRLCAQHHGQEACDVRPIQPRSKGKNEKNRLSTSSWQGKNFIPLIYRQTTKKGLMRWLRRACKSANVDRALRNYHQAYASDDDEVVFDEKLLRSRLAAWTFVQRKGELRPHSVLNQVDVTFVTQSESLGIFSLGGGKIMRSFWSLSIPGALSRRIPGRGIFCTLHNGDKDYHILIGPSITHIFLFNIFSFSQFYKLKLNTNLLSRRWMK